MSRENLKKAAGYKAVDFIQSGMTVGLGTGSTVKYFIEKLIAKHRAENLRIGVVASSIESLRMAREGGLPLSEINTLESIDITVDGADEIDSQKRMIKGGGGALLREKILAAMSRELVVIVDETKKVSLLGGRKLPVEIVPFAFSATLHHVKRSVPKAELRKKDSTQDLYLTDNGNYIIDIEYEQTLDNPEEKDRFLRQIPGVVETGFFFRLAGRVVTAYEDGQVAVTS